MNDSTIHYVLRVWPRVMSFRPNFVGIVLYAYTLKYQVLFIIILAHSQIYSREMTFKMVIACLLFGYVSAYGKCSSVWCTMGKTTISTTVWQDLCIFWQF